MKAFLARCADFDQEVLVQLARCIGELGAISPSYLSTDFFLPKRSSKLMTDNQLAMRILEDCVAPLLRSKLDPYIMYAVQVSQTLLNRLALALSTLILALIPTLT